MVGIITSDYGGRDIDVLVMDAARDVSSGAVSMRLRYTEPGKIVAGVQQTAQAYLSLLLTKKGTCRDRNVGTNFLKMLGSRVPRSNAEVTNYYLLTHTDAITQVNALAVEPDERIVSARLVSSAIQSTRISLRIHIITEAGESVQYIMPIEDI